MIRFISSLLHLFKHLETQVKSTPKVYFEKLLFLTYKVAMAILDGPCAVAKQHQNTIFEIEMQCTTTTMKQKR